MVLCRLSAHRNFVVKLQSAQTWSLLLLLCDILTCMLREALPFSVVKVHREHLRVLPPPWPCFFFSCLDVNSTLVKTCARLIEFCLANQAVKFE